VFSNLVHMYFHEDKTLLSLTENFAVELTKLDQNIQQLLNHLHKISNRINSHFSSKRCKITKSDEINTVDGVLED